MTAFVEYSQRQLHKGWCDGLQAWSSHVTLSFRGFMQQYCLAYGQECVLHEAHLALSDVFLRPIQGFPYGMEFILASSFLCVDLRAEIGLF